MALGGQVFKNRLQSAGIFPAEAGVVLAAHPAIETMDVKKPHLLSGAESAVAIVFLSTWADCATDFGLCQIKRVGNPSS